VDYTQAEQEFARRACALERAAHQVVLQALDLDAPHIKVDGTLYRRVLRSVGNYYSMAGPVEVKRSLYRTGETMAWECQRAPSREAETAADRWLRLPYSRSAFEHMMHEVGTHYQTSRANWTERVQICPDCPGLEVFAVAAHRAAEPALVPLGQSVGQPRVEPVNLLWLLG